MDFLNSSPSAVRRQVLGAIRAVRRELACITDRWDVTGTVFDRTLPHPDGIKDPRFRGDWRKRLPTEYPENQAEELGALCGELTRVIDMLTLLRDQANLRFLQLTTAQVTQVSGERPPTLGEK